MHVKAHNANDQRRLDKELGTFGKLIRLLDSQYEGEQIAALAKARECIGRINHLAGKQGFGFGEHMRQLAASNGNGRHRRTRGEEPMKSHVTPESWLQQLKPQNSVYRLCMGAAGLAGLISLGQVLMPGRFPALPSPLVTFVTSFVLGLGMPFFLKGAALVSFTTANLLEHAIVEYASLAGHYFIVGAGLLGLTMGLTAWTGHTNVYGVQIPAPSLESLLPWLQTGDAAIFGGISIVVFILARTGIQRWRALL